MTAEIITKIVNHSWVDPDTSVVLPIPLKAVAIESGIAGQAKDRVNALSLGKTYAVVSDANTHPVLGKAIEQALQGTSIILPKDVAPNEEAVLKVQRLSAACDVIVAVGSGTINDICKYASFLAKKPYIVFGTAPSMNGYSSANASISIRGHKKTLSAQLPQAIFLDLDILCDAPERQIRSGLGDSLCRPTAQADWLLSYHLMGASYRMAPFSLLAPFEKDLFSHAKALLKGDKEVMELLATTLILSGIGMYICEGSYPASQGEHMIAHTMEMVYGSQMPITYHGEHIGVTTLTMARMQETILKQSTPPRLQTLPWDAVTSKVTKYFGASLAKECLQDYQQKWLSPEHVDVVNATLDKQWKNIASQIEAVTVRAAKLEKVLKAIRAPIEPKDLGWEDGWYQGAICHARYTRNRFTFLDLVEI